jgi:hypothetical protein
MTDEEWNATWADAETVLADQNIDTAAELNNISLLVAASDDRLARLNAVGSKALVEAKAPHVSGESFH